ncbi:MAG: inositol monophosphatase family protein, partial [Pseudomonadota bacterium]
MTDMRNIDDTVALMRQLAGAAASAILPHFRAGTAIDDKGSAAFDPVTEADRAGERAMRAILAEQAPEDAIIGEE